MLKISYQRQQMIFAAMYSLNLMREDALHFLQELGFNHEAENGTAAIHTLPGPHLSTLNPSMSQLFKQYAEPSDDPYLDVVDIVDEVTVALAKAGYSIEKYDDQELKSLAFEMYWPLRNSVYTLEEGDHYFENEFLRISAYTVYGLCHYIECGAFDHFNQIPAYESKKWFKKLKQFHQRKEPYFKILAIAGLELADPFWDFDPFVPQIRIKRKPTLVAIAAFFIATLYCSTHDPASDGLSLIGFPLPFSIYTPGKIDPSDIHLANFGFNIRNFFIDLFLLGTVILLVNTLWFKCRRYR